jgi:hypothetical protein
MKRERDQPCDKKGRSQVSDSPGAEFRLIVEEEYFYKHYQKPPLPPVQLPYAGKVGRVDLNPLPKRQKHTGGPRTRKE